MTAPSSAHTLSSRKTYPPYAIVGGNPARLIRMRFDDATVTRLLELKWWQWPEERILQFIPDLLSGDIEGFLSKTEACS